MSESPRSVSFVASLPAIQSALSISGTGDGARIKLDIPQSDADVIPLIQIYFSGKAFRVTLELEEEVEHEQPSGTIRRTSAKRRK